MNRILLEQMLEKMKKLLKDGKNIGELKIGALFALGNQLEAIFYFIGHELGSKLDDKLEENDIAANLKLISEKYHLGEFEIEEVAPDHISFSLKNTTSNIDIDTPPASVKVPGGFCSFEAGLYAGVVEKLTGKHCFAQEIENRLQGNPMDKFMIVIPQD